MRMLSKFSIFISIALLLEISDAKLQNASSSSKEILCFSKVDKTRVVRCRSGCVQKMIVSRYRIDKEYSWDFHQRLGCDSRTLIPTLKDFHCDAKLKNGAEYTLDYMLEGSDDRHPRLFVRKTCCFHSRCNVPLVVTHRSWIRSDASMLSLLRKTYRSNSHILPVGVSLLVISLGAYGVVSGVLRWLESKKALEIGFNCRALEVDIVQESEFAEDSIIETDLQITGRLTIRETARLLAKLPDIDKVKFKQTLSKSLSSEESVKEMKETAVIVESVADRRGRKVVIKRPLKTRAAGWGHCLWNTSRTINSPNDLLYRMIEHGPYQYPFTALELLSLFEETAFKMADEPSLLQIDAEITVIGDIRGRYTDLHRWLQLTGWPPENRILFLGGILDSDEPGSVECLALICSLKCRFPKHVYILRGEPETSPFKMSQRLHPIITRAVQSCIKRMCSQMPFAAIIGKSVLAVYSGFSPQIREKAHIHHLFRPVPSEQLNDVEKHIIFNQPSNKVRMYRPNPKSEGDFFGKHAVKRACKAMRCNVIIRGQSHVPFGYLPFWNNRLINVWSAPGYGSNYGAVLYITNNLEITPILMEKQAKMG